jgi:hypothetical protein
MNADITDNGTESAKSELQGAFGSQSRANAISYGHPHSKQILSEACDVIRESESGALLLVLLDQKRIPVHIMKGNGESGFSPDMMTVVMQVPGKVETATAKFIIELIKGLHEAAQELTGFKTPDPTKDVMKYASFIHSRNLDSITEVCRIINELTNSSYFSVLLDTLTKLGLNNVYKAYIDGASREELYEAYADAYDNLVEGV